MPYTARQRRYFHAMAEKAKGKKKKQFAKLAAEADRYAKQGKEKK